VDREAVAIGVQRDALEIDPHPAAAVRELAQSVVPRREQGKTRRVPVAVRADAAGQRQVLLAAQSQRGAQQVQLGDEGRLELTGNERDCADAVRPVDPNRGRGPASDP